MSTGDYKAQVLQASSKNAGSEVLSHLDKSGEVLTLRKMERGREEAREKVIGTKITGKRVRTRGKKRENINEKKENSIRKKRKNNNHNIENISTNINDTHQ